MLRKGYLKSKISGENINSQSFGIGILIGAGISVAVSLFFNLGREAVRFITSYNNLIILTEKEWFVYDAFFFFVGNNWIGIHHVLLVAGF